MAKGRVLVVDDEPEVRRAARLVLSKAGYDVVEVEGGEQAIQVLRAGDNPLMVDVIVCDLVMLKVSGIEAISYFRSQFPMVPVLVLTGSRDIADITASFREGIADYLTKPITREDLVAAVAKAMSLRKMF